LVQRCLPGNDALYCVHDHDSGSEINLDYANQVNGPMPLEHGLIDDVTYHEEE